MKKVRTAVVGAGTMGKNHARLLSELADLVAVADTNGQVGKSTAKQYGAHFYDSHIKLIENEHPDAVVVAVPTCFHKEVAIDLLSNNIPVLLEKPIADTTENAKKILNVAEANRTTLLIGHIERYNPAVTKAYNLIRQNKFGEIISISATRIGIQPPKVGKSDVLLDLAIHDIDIFNYLLGKTPLSWLSYKRSIYDENIADAAAMILQYENTIGSIITNWVTPIKVRKLTITGTKLFAEVDYISQTLTIQQRTTEVTRKNGFFEFISNFSSPPREIPVVKKEPLREELRYFLKLVKRRKCDSCVYALEALNIALNPIGGTHAH